MATTNYIWRVRYHVKNASGQRVAGPYVNDLIAAPRTFSSFSHESGGNVTENAPPANATLATVITNNSLASVPSGGSIDVESISAALTPLAYS